MAEKNNPQSAEPVAWRELLTPHIARFEAAYVSGGDAVYNPIGSQAMAKLLSEIANKLDSLIALSLAERQAREAAERGKVEAIAVMKRAVDAMTEANNLLADSEASLAKAEARIAELEAAFLDIAHFTPDAATGVDRFEQIARHARATTLALLSSINKEPSHG